MGKDWGHIMIQFTRRALVISGFELYWYGLLIALGVFAGTMLAHGREKRLGLKKDTAFDLVLIGAPVAILLARLYYVAFSWDYYRLHPDEILAFRDGGMAIYGGVIGAVIAGWIYSKWKKIPFLKLADLAAPSLALGQCIGRWGNFLNQEAFGKAVSNPALQFFPLSVYIEGSGWHYAAFFYESLWCGLIVLALLAGERKGFFKRRGDLFLSYIFLYALERSIVEGLRTDSLYIGPFRISQLISLCAVIAFALILAQRLKGKNPVLRFLPVAAALLMAAAAACSTVLTLLTGLFLLAINIVLWYIYVYIQ